MRKLSLVISLCCILTFTGCTIQYDLSVQESDIIAESMAGFLLKHDSNYRKQSLLLQNEEIENEMTAIQTEVEEEGVTSQTITSNVSNNKEYTFTEVIGTEDFDIQYQRYTLYTNYPDDTSSTYFSLTPSEGNQLLVVSFAARNITKDTNNLNLIKSGVRFQLEVNEETNYVPLLTLMENDLQYINIPIEGDGMEEVILVFEILNKDIASVQLNVSKENKKANIILK